MTIIYLCQKELFRVGDKTDNLCSCGTMIQEVGSSILQEQRLFKEPEATRKCPLLYGVFDH